MLALIAGFGVLVRSASAAQAEEERVRAALMQSAAGFEKGDMAVLNKVWANDESVTVFVSGVNYFFSSATIRIPVPLGQVKPLGATEKLVRGQI